MCSFYLYYLIVMMIWAERLEALLFSYDHPNITEAEAEDQVPSARMNCKLAKKVVKPQVWKDELFGDSLLPLFSFSVC